jgi:hypothetical protein
MPGADPPSADPATNGKLAQIIENLPEERQLVLLKQLLKDNLTTALLGIIRKMTEHEKLTLLAQLQPVAAEADGLEETEITLRSFSRKSCMLRIDYTIEGRNFEGFILDISPAGAFIESGEAFKAGRQIQLTFSVPTHPEQMTISGEILWKGLLGMGIKFLDISREQIESIAAFMKEE